MKSTRPGNSLRRRGLIAVCCAWIAPCALASQHLSLAADDPYAYTLAELETLHAKTLASLTLLESRKSPAQLTLIDEAMLDSSGARHVVDLLDIYVPGFQVMRHPPRISVWGTRGVNADNTKYLMLLDGRRMNENFWIGAFPETLLPMKGDLKEVEYVNGPGSVVYGSGAVGGVVNLKTKRADDIIPEGQDSGGFGAVSQSYIDRGEWVEGGYASRHSENLAVSFYAGLGRYIGVRGDDQNYYSHLTYQGIPAGEEWPDGYTSDSGETSYGSPLKQKFMAQVEAGPLRSWARYTKSYSNTILRTVPILTSPNPHVGVDYEQFTWHNEWEKALGDNVKLEFSGGYQWTRSEQHREHNLYRAPQHSSSLEAQEHQMFGRAQLVNQFGGGHQLAVGTDLTYMWIDSSVGNRPRADMQQMLYSFFAEYQAPLGEDWVAILGARYDEDRFTDSSISPRASLIWTPTEEDTIKMIYAHSFRDRPLTNILRDQERGVAGTSQDEALVTYELLYDRDLQNKWKLSLGSYWSEAELVGSVSNFQISKVVGQADHYGFSIGLSRSGENWRMGISHNYDDVSSFEQYEVVQQTIYVEGGKSLVSWSGHSSKLYGWCQLTESISMDGNIQIKWLYGGLEEQYEAGGFTPAPESSYDADFGPIVDVNMGVAYQFRKNHVLRLDMYNLVALFDRDLNRQLTRGTLEYESPPFSCALSYKVKF